MLRRRRFFVLSDKRMKPMEKRRKRSAFNSSKEGNPPQSGRLRDNAGPAAANRTSSWQAVPGVTYASWS